MKSLVVFCCLCVVACAPVPTAVLTPQQIAQRASDRMQAVKSFHFSIDVSGKPKLIDPTGAFAIRHADGDVLRPDRAKSRIRVSFSGLLVEMQATAIGAQQWLTNPLTQRWEVAPSGWGYNPAVLFDAQHGLASLLNRVQNLSSAPDESFENQRHYRLIGTVAGADVAGMTANMVSGSDVSFTLWIGADDFVLRRVHLSEKNAGDKDSTEWEVVLAAFDQPLTIEPPSN